jgi:LPS-assembly protein
MIKTRIFSKQKQNVKYSDKIDDITITTDKAIYYINDGKIYTFGNSKVVSDSNTITASDFKYDKINNTYIAIKNVEVNDFEKNTTIYADKTTYLKNEEKIYTKGKTIALIENKYKFNSKNVSYFKSSGDLFSKKELLS